jgi:hypothetical protein
MSSLNEIVDDTAKFEVIKFRITLVISMIICAICLVFGIYLVFKKDNYVSIQGVVVSKTCSKTPNQVCTYVISYNVNGFQYQNSIELNQPYSVGNPVQIEYDTTSPNSIQNPRLKLIYIGFIVIGFGLFFLGVAYINYYFATRSKVYAVASGVSDASNFLRNTL